MSRIRNIMVRIWRVFTSLVGTVFMILGIAGTPDDVLTWEKWLRQLGSYLTSVQDWKLVTFGVILIGMNIVPYAWGVLRSLRRRLGNFDIAELLYIDGGTSYGNPRFESIKVPRCEYPYLQIRNLGPTVLDAQTKLTFRNSSGELILGPVHGVWFLERGELGSPAKFLDSKPAHINNNETRQLAVAMKLEVDDEAYALCEQSVGFLNWKNPKLHLPTLFQFEVEIWGSNFKPYMFKGGVRERFLQN